MFGRIAGAALAAIMLAACGNGADGARGAHEREGDFAKGRADAPVTLIEYASPACPACAAFRREAGPAIDEAVRQGRLRVVFREMISGEPRLAVAGFMAARCAGERRYLDVMDDLLDRQEAIYAAAGQGRALAELERSAAAGGVSADAFRACLSDEAMLADVEAASQRSAADGIGVTPSFLINGEALTGARVQGVSGAVWTLGGETLEDEGGPIPADFSADGWRRVIAAADPGQAP
ncbi:DsbA family protein [Glycocaulis profundi]|nr:DsbA family protein [Glycocaulis profundi]